MSNIRVHIERRGDFYSYMSIFGIGVNPSGIHIRKDGVTFGPTFRNTFNIVKED